MNNWWFALAVFGFGLFLAILVDRMRSRSEGTPEEQRRRSRWLEYWFTGRLPLREDEQKREDEKRNRRGKK